jgi:2,3-bisphosphoglycerate-independent phosphoglycerate mutase
MKKIILIVIDGLGDEPIPQLNNKTPLEAAKTPNFDFLAKNGICGLVLPWHEKGKLPTSEETHLAIFGYNPKKLILEGEFWKFWELGRKLKKGMFVLEEILPRLMKI